jgi:hypothetical protein
VTPPSDVAASRAELLTTVRNEMFAGIAPVSVFAEAIRKSLRTVERMIKRREIPTVTIGRDRYVVTGGAREAVMATARIEPPKTRLIPTPTQGSAG